MIKNTFSTLKKNPMILVMFLMLFVVSTLLTTVPVFFGMPSFSSFSSVLRNGDFQPSSLYIILIGLSFVGFIIIATLMTPAVGNYVYEVCADKREKGWYKRGIKRNWWKIVAFAAIFAGILIVAILLLSVLFSILRAILIILVPMLVIFLIALYTYMFIGMSAIYAEESFLKALTNIFKVGNKYFFKLLGTSVLAFLPMYIATVIYSNSYMRSASSTGIYSIGYWIFTVLYGLYGVCAVTFINTYSMKRYLNEKDLYEQGVVGTLVSEGGDAEVDEAIEEMKE